MSIAPISLLDGIASTRAIRRYTDDPVNEDDLAAMLFAATRAPTGSNRQTFKFLVLRDGPVAVEAKAILGESFRAGWQSKRSTDQYDRTDDETSAKARMARTMQHFVDHFEQTPVVVLACVLRRHGGLADGGSIFPACQNLLLAARGLGYGGVLTGWHAMVEVELRALCRIPDTHDIAATIPIGVPQGHHGPVRRRPVRELVFDDVWDGAASWAVDPPGTRFTQAGPPTATGATDPNQYLGAASRKSSPLSTKSNDLGNPK